MDKKEENLKRIEAIQKQLYLIREDCRKKDEGLVNYILDIVRKLKKEI